MMTAVALRVAGLGPTQQGIFWFTHYTPMVKSLCLIAAPGWSACAMIPSASQAAKIHRTGMCASFSRLGLVEGVLSK